MDDYVADDAVSVPVSSGGSAVVEGGDSDDSWVEDYAC